LTVTFGAPPINEPSTGQSPGTPQYQPHSARRNGPGALPDLTPYIDRAIIQALTSGDGMSDWVRIDADDPEASRRVRCRLRRLRRAAREAEETSDHAVLVRGSRDRLRTYFKVLLINREDYSRERPSVIEMERVMAHTSDPPEE
jgi:hypothetical protein